jgi:hypothetical protein
MMILRLYLGNGVLCESRIKTGWLVIVSGKNQPDILIADDLHTHLYGCLTAVDIWELGRTVWKYRIERLEAYAARFAAAFGYRPDFARYWVEDHGSELIASEWMCKGRHNFEQFEARFGLAIALFPISPARDDLRVLEAVMHRHALERRRYVEYRLVYPPSPSKLDLGEYLSGLCSSMARFASEHGGSFKPRLALSLSRDPVYAMEQYHHVRNWVEAAPAELTAFVTGIDFSGYEEAYEADGLIPIAKRIHEDNRTNPRRALALLVHAGETMEDKQTAKALARIEAAVAMGAHRIGHATAAGISFASGSLEEQMQQRIFERLSGPSAPVIECCISSNMCLAGVGNPSVHPARGFMERGLRVCFATDDPGIFGTDASLEAKVAISCVGEKGFISASVEAAHARSEILSGRSDQ